MQKWGLSVLETIGPQAVSPSGDTAWGPGSPECGEGSVGAKDFFYFKMPRPSPGPNRFFF